MRLELKRVSKNTESTIGALFLDGEFQCYTIEDEERTVKVKGETRIPEGFYSVGVRDVGGFHSRYSQKFPQSHKGMLQILDVPNFEYILIHIGNDDDDTAGCILVGNKPNNNKREKGFLGDSTSAYLDLYKKVIDEAINGCLTITITDLEDGYT